MAISPGVAHSDLVWCETLTLDLLKAKLFAEGSKK